MGVAWLAAMPLGAAAVVDVGASGQCYDAASNGGGDQVRVRTDTNSPIQSLSIRLLTVTGAVAGIAQFAMGVVAIALTLDPLHGDACPNRDTLDYIEADATVGGVASAQACYDGNVRTDGGCPHSPAGPGAPG
jgi:hypothetical protein